MRAPRVSGLLMLIAESVALTGVLLSGTLADTKLGSGGVERWIAYPTVLWLVAFGGYLLAARSEERRGA